ncbi:PAS domain-containing sensor histidine kinase [Pseudoduganella sp. SL102]|uniref:sensor histidine kinase n=1 Tax=Pseudoduganella sp. SL102 TaxID=2995154 RepID=UPI00248C3BB1|nr:PAS domain-containing sensor histidine kinase [Pseudoduganella sp. SL102]WBS00114.1 PAS domain-containing sensor histidine kinase [Pseudoduganella sp. SL102]
MTTDYEQPSPCPWPTGLPWTAAYDWAIGHMPCPAFRCDAQGAVVGHNAAAERIWGGPPSPVAGLWSGFAALRRPDGTPVAPSDSPAAVAASGALLFPEEMLVKSLDGQSRHVVFHARPLLDGQGRPGGSLCVLTDVSERRRLEDKAKAAEEDRSVFLSMLGHELRNPLAPIMSAATAMRALSADPSISRMAEVVERQAHQLSRFIADLLHAARLDGPAAVPIAQRDTDVGEVLDRAVDIASASMRARGQSLCVDAANRSVGLRCDPERIAQALGNALLNASDYSPAGASIGLRASVGGGLLEASVSDEGMGIEPGHLGEIFEPFKRFAAAPNKPTPGAGLGLSIAKSVAEAHGGAVFVRSAGPGLGTTVTFALPIARPSHCPRG